MVDQSAVRQLWSNVSLGLPVPSQLYDHQADAMTLVRDGNHVFLG